MSTAKTFPINITTHYDATAIFITLNLIQSSLTNNLECINISSHPLLALSPEVTLLHEEIGDLILTPRAYDSDHWSGSPVVQWCLHEMAMPTCHHVLLSYQVHTQCKISWHKAIIIYTETHFVSYWSRVEWWTEPIPFLSPVLAELCHYEFIWWS